MANSITAPYGLETNNPQPEIKRYYNLAQAPYENTAQVLSEVALAVRYIGQTFNVDNIEYWFRDGVADLNLVEKVLPITSTDLIVTNNVDGITINLPETSDIPSLIVNNAYTPTYREFIEGNDRGNGTVARPFTDTITSWSLGGSPVKDTGSAIQNALDAYKGTGGRGTTTPLDTDPPELLNSIIQIEKGNTVYNFAGDFDYKDIKIALKAGAVISSTPTGDWLMDFTKFSTTTTHNPEITFEQGAYIYCNKNGFKVVGGNFTAPTSNRKSLTVGGSAKRTGLVLVGTSESHILFEVNGGGETFANGGYQNLIISTFISTNRGKLFSIKGNGVVSCEDILTFILNDANGAVITATNPIIELDGTAALYYINSQIQVNKTPTVTYRSLVSIASTSSALFEARDSTFTGFANYLVYNSNTARTAIVRLDACKMYIDTSSTSGSFAGTVSGVWSNFYLTNNNMPNTNINPATTTILPSAINTIGGNVIETLPYYNSRTLASSAGVPLGGKFINMASTGDSTLWKIDIIVQ